MTAGGRNWRALGGVAVAVVVAIAVGAAASAVIVTPARPEVLSTPEAIRSAPVATQSYDDRRLVTVGFTLGGGTSLTSPADGRITSFTCTPGSTLTSGDSALAIDGAPVLTLSTIVPLWRDLAAKDRGQDVSALQRELARLGEPVTVDGVLGRETLDALERRLRRLGDTGTVETVSTSRILWVPSPSVTIDECTLGTGTTAAAGEPLATLAAGLSAAAIDQMPGDLIPGDRVLVVDGQRLPVGADGTVTDPAALATLTASSSLREAMLGESASFTANLDLVDPVEIAVVPPSAVVAVDGSSGCVVTDGVAAPVDIVGSQLGQTLVRFADDTSVPENVDIAPREKTTCG